MLKPIDRLAIRARNGCVSPQPTFVITRSPSRSNRRDGSGFSGDAEASDKRFGCGRRAGAASFASGQEHDRTIPPAQINDNFNHAQSNVVGAGLGEVFALSCALSRHQGRPSPQRAARSWISAHRCRAAFSTLSRQRVLVFPPWQTSFPSETRSAPQQPLGAPAGSRIDATA
jgi:hypothetical protein